jgi:transposase
MIRLYGRCEANRRLVDAAPHGHWNTSTFIEGLRRDRLTAPCVFSGAVNGEMLLYLPPYSPDLNPIEQAFAKLKALLRARALRTIDALWQALGDLVGCFTPAECANFVTHSGYVGSP